MPELKPTTATSAEVKQEIEVGPVAIVGGCGHVGLPLGIAFARQGISVDLLDTHEPRVLLVNQGMLPFHEEGADALLPGLIASGLLKATTSASALENADAIIVTIGTGVDAYQDPTVAEFDRSMEALVARIRPGQILILRSTILPGLTDRLHRQLQANGLEDIDLAYCPEPPSSGSWGFVRPRAHRGGQVTSGARGTSTIDRRCQREVRPTRC